MSMTTTTTTTTTTTRDRGDRYGPMEWAQSVIIRNGCLYRLLIMKYAREGRMRLNCLEEMVSGMSLAVASITV